MARIMVRADRAYRKQIDPRRLREAVRKTLEHESAPSRAELTLVITGDDKVRDLNRRYRGMDAPTDVLSFAEAEADMRLAEPDYLGDVVVSYPRAKAQAASAAHPVTAELLLLVVHGVLHLLGHDHADRVGKRKMWAAQKEILNELGAGTARVSPVRRATNLRKNGKMS
jgi:probable rRNA maturation factor